MFCLALSCLVFSCLVPNFAPRENRKRGILDILVFCPASSTSLTSSASIPFQTLVSAPYLSCYSLDCVPNITTSTSNVEIARGQIILGNTRAVHNNTEVIILLFLANLLFAALFFFLKVLTPKIPTKSLVLGPCAAPAAPLLYEAPP
jgi:hypothetical protein